MADNKIGNTAEAEAPQGDALIPVRLPTALKLRVVERVGKGNVSPYVRALIEADMDKAA